MKLMRYTIFGIFISMIMIGQVDASSISIKASNKNITKGNSVTITTTIISDSPVVSIEGAVTCKGAGVNNSINLNYDDMSNSIKTKTYSLKVKPTNTGTITCTTSGVRFTSMSSGSWQNLSNKNVNITVKEKNTSTNTTTTKKETKSSNNNLKRLEVEGFNLNPSFSPSVTEYTVNASHDVTKVKIHAWTEHEKGDLSGDGEKDVKEGNNTFEVSVKAENGSKKIYKINVVVDSKPINVEFDGKKYTMIKESSDLPETSLEHEIIKLNIEDQEVEAYRIDSISYVLVGLRDESGNVNLYKFDSFKDDTIPFKYTLYQEFDSNTITIINIEPDENLIPKGYKKEEIVVNDKKIIAYKNENQEYYLVYGINTETGKPNLYTFDKEEVTLQKYIEKEEEISNDILKKIFIVFSSIVAILMAIIIALLNQLKKRN